MLTDVTGSPQGRRADILRLHVGRRACVSQAQVLSRRVTEPGLCAGVAMDGTPLSAADQLASFQQSLDLAMASCLTNLGFHEKMAMMYATGEL